MVVVLVVLKDVVKVLRWESQSVDQLVAWLV